MTKCERSWHTPGLAKSPSNMGYPGLIAIALALGLSSGCGSDIVVVANAGGVHLRICKGDDDFCQEVLNPPKADAGPNRTVAGGSRVILDGSASNDTDGRITAFQWLQTDGPLVSLSDPNSATPSFDAPAVSQTTVLGFELTVTDDDNDTDTDPVEIVVQPRTAMSASRGLEWLQNSLSPATDGMPRDVGSPDPTSHSTIGAWLVATTTGRYLDRDPTHVESHLANLRGLITSLEQQSVTKSVVPATPSSDVLPCGSWGGTPILVAGLAQTASMLDGLDASLAKRYRARAETFGVAPDWNDLNSLYRAQTPIQHICEAAPIIPSRLDTIARATSILLELAPGGDADTLQVAAATLTVLGALEHDDPQVPPVPTSTQIPLSQRSTATPLLTNTPSP
ncbi:MAG: PKD domain-containing protein [Pseudomonadales bacterium]